MSLFTDVGEFHKRFDLPHADQRAPVVVPFVEFKYRIAFLMEEITEFIEAYGRSDLTDIADALADLVWVALGTAHYFGVPFDEVWAEVKRANMTKRPWQEGDPLKPRNALTFGEVVKPDGWRPPDVLGVLDEIGRASCRERV